MQPALVAHLIIMVHVGIAVLVARLIVLNCKYMYVVYIAVFD